MRAKEFIVEDLEEGWKERAIGAGVIGAGLAGAFGPGVMKHMPKSDGNSTRPAITRPHKQITQPTIKTPGVQQNKTADRSPDKEPQKADAPKEITPAFSLPSTSEIMPSISWPTAKEVTPKVSMPAPVKYKEAQLRPTLEKAAHHAGIKGKELAQFLAQAKHETMGFTRMTEFGDADYFTKHYDPTANPDKAKILGNTQKGDGIKYRGRGFLQITGRDNYTRCGDALNLPLEQHPELLERPEIAAKASIWFWKERVRPNVKNFSNTKQATKGINPALRGLANRFQSYKDELARLMVAKPPKHKSKNV